MTGPGYDITLKADMSRIPQARDRLEEAMRQAGFSVRETLEAQLALEEACTNIVMYAYPDGPGTIHISVRIAGDILDMDIEDSGLPFDPASSEAVLPSGGVEDRPAGGMGIYLMRKLTDWMAHDLIDGRNILYLRKIKHH